MYILQIMKKHLEKTKKIIQPKLQNLSTSSLKIPALTLVLGLMLGYLVSSVGVLPNPSHVSADKTKTLIESYLQSSGIPEVAVNDIIAEGDLYKVSLNVQGFD